MRLVFAFRRRNFALASPIPRQFTQTIWRSTPKQLSSARGERRIVRTSQLFTIMDSLVSVGCQQTIWLPLREAQQVALSPFDVIDQI
jgi:hypothetical protein